MRLLYLQLCKTTVSTFRLPFRRRGGQPSAAKERVRVPLALGQRHRQRDRQATRGGRRTARHGLAGEEDWICK